MKIDEVTRKSLLALFSAGYLSSGFIFWLDSHPYWMKILVPAAIGMAFAEIGCLLLMLGISDWTKVDARVLQGVILMPAIGF